MILKKRTQRAVIEAAFGDSHTSLFAQRM